MKEDNVITKIEMSEFQIKTKNKTNEIFTRLYGE